MPNLDLILAKIGKETKQLQTCIRFKKTENILLDVSETLMKQERRRHTRETFYNLENV